MNDDNMKWIDQSSPNGNPINPNDIYGDDQDLINLVIYIIRKDLAKRSLHSSDADIQFDAMNKQLTADRRLQQISDLLSGHHRYGCPFDRPEEFDDIDMHYMTDEKLTAILAAMAILILQGAKPHDRR